MFTDNKDFYPTPKEVIEKMLAPYEVVKDWYNHGISSEYRKILEPSAGKWDIVDYMDEKYRYYWRRETFVFEKDFNLQEILSKKQVKFLWDDFLAYTEDTNFDLIIMNPPFSNWVDHLLKAWEIAWNTDIVCLLNAETLKNPHSKKRQLLAKIIEDNSWEIEYLGSCFDNAERKTGVEVAMVRLKKTQKSFEFDFDMDTEADEIIDEDFAEKWLMTNNKIESIVSQYHQSREIMKNVLREISKLDSVLKQVSPWQERGIWDILNSYWNNQEKYDSFLSSIKAGIWRDLIRKSKIERYMTSKLRKNFESFVNNQSNIEISEKNIMKFIEFVMINKWSILENAIEEVFDDITSYDIENRLYPEGWKTNDSWKVNKKFILWYFGLSYETRWGGSFNFYGSDKLDNIDKVMAYITWKDWTNTVTLVDTIKRGIQYGHVWTWLESEFFEVKFYKKGSAHIKFKDEYLWQEFNMRACAMKNWLPKAEADSWKKQKENADLKKLS